MKQSVAKAEQSAIVPVSDLEQEMLKHAGLGISNRPQDNLIPGILLLQPLSPQVMDGPVQIADARPGDFLFADGKLIKGSVGFWFQFCGQQNEWVEKEPRDKGAAYVASYFLDYDDSGKIIPPPTAEKVDAYNYQFPNGNECIHYRRIAGMVWEEGGVGKPFVISFKGTGHTIVRKWMTAARTANAPPSSTIQMPLCANLWRLTSSQKRNKRGQWYSVEVDMEHPVLISRAPETLLPTEESKNNAWYVGKALLESWTAGEKRAAPDDDGAGGEDGDGSM